MATALAALVTVLIAATTILHLTYRPRAWVRRRSRCFNAAYFTVETVTTVGYGDFCFRGQPDVADRRGDLPHAARRDCSSPSSSPC